MTWRRALNLMPELLALILIALAFVPGVQATADLNWPGDQDLFRDIAQAQTFVDGGWLADPYYLNESLWYNPLAASIVAAAARVTHQPVPLLYTRLGAYLNLIAPIGLYLLVTLLIHRRAALIALAAFLFIAPATQEPSWALGTYSPWLFAANFAQGWFYLTLAAYVIALRRRTRRWFALTGGLLGLTFLAHTAPAVIAGGVIALHTLIRLVRERDRRRVLIGFGAILIVALIVSAPLTISIVGRYRLHVLNSAPTNWAYEPLTLRNFDAFVQDNFVQRVWIVGAAVIGLIAVLRQRAKPIGSIVLIGWLLITISLLIYHYVRQLAKRDGVILPTVIPGFHFLMYFRVALSVLLGAGLATLAGLIARMLARPRASITAGLAYALSIACAAALVVTAYPTYQASDDLIGQRAEALNAAQNVDRIAAYEWVRATVAPQTVFLASDPIGTYVIGPAGRKLIAADSVFASPYVDWASRNADREALWAALDAHAATAFRAGMSQYQAEYVVVTGNRLARLAADPPLFIKRVFDNATLAVYQVLP